MRASSLAASSSHVLPPGFMRLRHYDLLGNRDRGEKLSRCRKLLELPDSNGQEPEQPPDWKSAYETFTGESFDTCPSCHFGHMVCVEILSSSVYHRAPGPTRPAIDSS